MEENACGSNMNANKLQSVGTLSARPAAPINWINASQIADSRNWSDYGIRPACTGSGPF
jgi:hypothetical protein